ncbi:hypothetical protein DRJ17_04585 [Candidatus Woesearchaeota archaeon]|nr:MAG: hypothetical protein DRJ17_04585 [Candidatus Woesearchaeota archaeon]
MKSQNIGLLLERLFRVWKSSQFYVELLDDLKSSVENLQVDELGNVMSELDDVRRELLRDLEVIIGKLQRVQQHSKIMYYEICNARSSSHEWRYRVWVSA